MDPNVLIAIIGAIGTVSAAFVGVLTWYLASRADRWRESAERETARQRDELARNQRVLDLVVALHSEILAGVVANSRQLTPEEAGYALDQQNPFATADETDFVFETVRADISILPVEVIHSVVQYYRAAKQSNLLTHDLRHPHFLTQSPEEKRRIIRMLLGIVELQRMLGEAAVQDLKAYASAQGLDLAAREERATRLVGQARADLTRIFTISERSDPSSEPSPTPPRE